MNFVFNVFYVQNCLNNKQKMAVSCSSRLVASISASVKFSLPELTFNFHKQYKFEVKQFRLYKMIVLFENVTFLMLQWNFFLTKSECHKNLIQNKDFMVIHKHNWFVYYEIFKSQLTFGLSRMYDSYWICYLSTY